MEKEKANSKTNPTYLEMLSSSTSDSENLYIAKDALHSLNGNINETSKALDFAKRDYARSKSANPYSAKTEIELEQKVEGLEKGLLKLKSIKAERFHDVAID